MKVAADFKGKDRSMGYRNGERYILRLHNFSPRSSCIVATPVSNLEAKPCPYRNVDALLENWENISPIEGGE